MVIVEELVAMMEGKNRFWWVDDVCGRGVIKIWTVPRDCVLRSEYW